MGRFSSRFPKTLSGQDLDNSAVLVVVYHSQASLVNRKSGFRRVNLVRAGPGENNARELVGCRILLPRPTNAGSSFTFGRARRNATLDIYLPDTQMAIKQFTLIPDIEKDFWRIQSNSETVTIIDGVPIQKFTPRTRKSGSNFPEAVYLEQNVSHHITIKNLQLTIWLLKSPRDAVQAGCVPILPHLLDRVQVVDGRDEDWADAQYIQTAEPVQISASSIQIINRFTGVFKTAKLFSKERNGFTRRDVEFLTMAKLEANRSIVQYLETTEIGGAPTIITTTHEGFVPYAVCHHEISNLHPTFRFRIASRLLRRLFQAVNFLHFNSIIHGNMSRESVLLRMMGNEVDSVLIVNYSSVWSFATGEEIPRKAMITDARAIMEIVEESCDLWTLRNEQAPQTILDAETQRRTAEASQVYRKVRRVAADFFEVQKGSRDSERGRNILRLVQRKRAALARAQKEQIANTTNRIIMPVTEQKLREIDEDWSNSHPGSSSRPPLVLSLGHKFLDDLANGLYLRNWDLTPRQICATLKAMEGECEDPWRTFAVTRKFPIHIARSRGGCLQIREHDLAMLVADIVKSHSREIDGIRKLYRQHLTPTSEGSCSFEQLNAFIAHVRNQSLASSILDSLIEIQGPDREGTLKVERTTLVAYHVPSRMFNLTRLQEAADSSILRECIRSNTVTCNHFVGVRGEEELEGCYAPLDLLSSFSKALSLKITDEPTVATTPTLDPADFSQNNLSGRIVLAHKSLVGYASMSRTTPQITHCPKDVTDISSTTSFLQTYFGNMKVLPSSSTGVSNHEQPAHWSQFEPSQSPQTVSDPSSSTLDSILFHNQSLRTTSPHLSPRKRVAPSTSSSSPPSKRAKTTTPRSPPLLPRMDPRLYSSILNAEKLHLLQDTASPDDAEESFTVAASSTGLEDDRAMVDGMIKGMMADSDEEVEAWTNFVFHGLKGSHGKSGKSLDGVEQAIGGGEEESVGSIASKAAVGWDRTKKPERRRRLIERMGEDQYK